ncbi:GntR family transcriptional regulator [Nocardia paucivorans]|uniref:GntR family transcriptional regulator n=1 Tax=Nocardia paucivorans TaxID=114259 RepID=UPI0005944DBE|nr:GntR family transcriptional regulator [Nocardia paucivorans]
MPKKYSSAELAYREVKERILSGALPGGELISEGEVAAELGTSRTPVREAFLRLETEGWMKLYPKRGALVTPIPAREAEHVVHARYVVETAAVRALNESTRAEVVPILRESLHRQRDLARTADYEQFAVVDTDFHRTYVVAADNPLLTGFYDSLRERQRRMNSAALHRRSIDVEQIIDQHVRLADHIEAGDTEAFATELVAHLSGVHQLELKGLL